MQISLMLTNVKEPICCGQQCHSVQFILNVRYMHPPPLKKK
uniref:Uncharacterized protein n=1 Tax=Anguilla anguilla TaxID=7936 RepID=A0A0E9T2T9_ANGAN